MKYLFFLLFLFVSVNVLSGCSLSSVDEQGEIGRSVDPNPEVVKGFDNPLVSILETPDRVQETVDDAVSLKNKQVQDALDMVSDANPRVILETNMGDITIVLFEDVAPKTVENFLSLSEKGFYDGTKFHRVISKFMIQGGDPLSKDDDWSDDGTGGPEYQFSDEFNDRKLVRGSLAMANAGPNTNGSQFFIVTAPETPHLDGKHTNFGQVVLGMDVVDSIERIQTNENDHPVLDVVVKGVSVVE